MDITLRPRQFSTGSIGFYGFGKVVVEGKVCQASLNVVQVGSKGANLPAPKGGDRIVKLNGVALNPTQFKTGSKGFRANGKVAIDGKVYQVGGNVTIIGSKGN